MKNCKDKAPAPLHFSDIGFKRKQKLYRVAKARGKSYIEMLRNWIDGMKDAGQRK